MPNSSAGEVTPQLDTALMPIQQQQGSSTSERIEAAVREANRVASQERAAVAAANAVAAKEMASATSALTPETNFSLHTSHADANMSNFTGNLVSTLDASGQVDINALLDAAEKKADAIRKQVAEANRAAEDLISGKSSLRNMTSSTTKSESIVMPRLEGCMDSSNNCQDWAAAGDCSKNPAYMLAECPRACKNCPGEMINSSASNLSVPISSSAPPLHVQEKMSWATNEGLLVPPPPAPPADGLSLPDHNDSNVSNVSEAVQGASNTTNGDGTTPETSMADMPSAELFPPPPAAPDKENDCYGWALKGECEKNPEWMRDNCATSCASSAAYTPPPPAPSDREADCHGWAEKGECERNPKWMHENCATSCANEAQLPPGANETVTVTTGQLLPSPAATTPAEEPLPPETDPSKGPFDGAQHTDGGADILGRLRHLFANETQETATEQQSRIKSDLQNSTERSNGANITWHSRLDRTDGVGTTSSNASEPLSRPGGNSSAPITATSTPGNSSAPGALVNVTATGNESEPTAASMSPTNTSDFASSFERRQLQRQQQGQSMAVRLSRGNSSKGAPSGASAMWIVVASLLSFALGVGITVVVMQQRAKSKTKRPIQEYKQEAVAESDSL